MQSDNLEGFTHSVCTDYDSGNSMNGRVSQPLCRNHANRAATTIPGLTIPLCFTSSLQPRVWGGRALSALLNHSLPTDEPYGEAWDLSMLPEHDSQVADGPHGGRVLSELWNKHRNDFVGEIVTNEESFPLLIKWLECRDWLSVQVHPDDAMAREVLNEPRGKSEVWIVLQADPTARILAGLKRGITRERFVQHLQSGTLDECLHSFAPRPGDCVVLPAGTVHAAGGGILIAEVQQSSNATFRLFDWNRLGLNGQPRPLQIDLGMMAIDWNQGPVDPVRPIPLEIDDGRVRGEQLTEMPSFRLERYTVATSWNSPYPGEMTVWMVLDGDAILSHPQTGEQRVIPMGRTVVVPAATGDTVWTPTPPANQATLLCVRLPQSR